jgi:cysteine dioxygenase
MLPALAKLFAELDRYDAQIPVEVLRAGLQQLEISLADVRRWAQFGRERYQRNLMHAGPAYEALLLCWSAGQRSPIHDHRGSACAFRVIEGTAAETQFERTADGLVFATRTHDMPEGTICATFDADVHQVSNLQAAGKPLITLHIYSPALRVCNVYSLLDAGSQEWYDPVFEFAEGSGI